MGRSAGGGSKQHSAGMALPEDIRRASEKMAPTNYTSSLSKTSIKSLCNKVTTSLLFIYSIPHTKVEIEI